MNKKLLLLITIIIIGFAQQTKSQVIIGLLFGEKLNKGPIEFGLNLAANQSTTSINNGSTYRTKLGFGLYLDYKINENLILSGAFFFSSPKGEKEFNESDPLYALTDSLFSGSKTERIMNYFEFPLIFKYRAFKRVGIGFGGYVSYLVNAHDQYHLSGNDGDIVHQRSILPDLNRFDYGLIGNLHYHFKGNPGSQIQFNYLYGLGDILRNGDFSQGSNETYQLSVLIPIKFGVLPSEPIDPTE